MTTVAVPVLTGRGCIVCSLPHDQRTEVNAAIWQGRKRVADYIAAGHRTFAQVAGRTCDRKTITRHADHIEATWREASVDDPATRREAPVFPTDYESMVDRAAILGMQAMSHLELRIATGELGDRELLGVAKMGVMSRAQQRATEVDASRPQVMLMAVFGLASGHLAHLPETEAITVIEEGSLRANVSEQRRLLEERARG